MQSLILKDIVTVHGLDVYGLPSHISFVPSVEPGWHWRYDPQQSPIPIDLNILRLKKRSLALEYAGASLNVYEHIGPLRYTGLDHVEIHAPTNPPYFGRTKELWDAIEPQTTQGEHQIEWFSFARDCFESDKSRHVHFYGCDDKSLGLLVEVNYPNLGRLKISRIYPKDNVEGAFVTHTQGWPMWLYYASWCGQAAGIWKHHGDIVWPQQHDHVRVLQLFCSHRALDLLGALSLASHQKLLAGKVLSYCGGHKIDFGLMHQLQKVTEAIIEI